MHHLKYLTGCWCNMYWGILHIQNCTKHENYVPYIVRSCPLYMEPVSNVQMNFSFIIFLYCIALRQLYFLYIFDILILYIFTKKESYFMLMCTYTDKCTVPELFTQHSLIYKEHMQFIVINILKKYFTSILCPCCDITKLF